MTAFLVVAGGNAILLKPLFALPSNTVPLPMFQTGESGAGLHRREWSEIQSLSQPPRPVHPLPEFPCLGEICTLKLVELLFSIIRRALKVQIQLKTSTLSTLPAPKHPLSTVSAPNPSEQTQLQSWSRACCSHLLKHLFVLVVKDTEGPSDLLHPRAQQMHHVDICHAMEGNLLVLISLETQSKGLRS